MKIAILLYHGITLLDAVGPYEVLSNLDDAKIYFVAKKRGNIKVDTGFTTIKAKYSFKEVSNADILVIPGAAISFLNVLKDEATLDWIKKIDATTQFTTSVCSGSVILAKTGLLQDYNATSHWKTLGLLKDYNVTPLDERIVKDGKYITAAGVSAGIDMALFLCDELVGEDETKAIQLLIEYDPNPIYKSGNFQNCAADIIELAEKKLKKNAKREMSFYKMFKNRKVLKKMK
ncbi:MAG: DJ-1/PfpI family protein [Flavobacteriaceae bacterium]